MAALLTHDEQALSLGLQAIDDAFPGFKAGDLVVLHGHPFCRTLAFILSVRCQLVREKGGLNSSTVYVDGGNTFNPYAISAMAQECGLDPKSMLEGIFVSRAFTAYQLSALLLNTLEDVLKRCRAKLVLVSDILSLFLDSDVPMKESIEVFNKVMVYLSSLVVRRNLIVVATSFSGLSSRRCVFLESALFGRANTVIRVDESEGELQFILEKHPRLTPFTINVLPNEVTLEKFCGGFDKWVELLPRTGKS